MNTTSSTDFFADLTDEEFDRVSAMDASEIRAEQIRRNAHIVNGGEATFPCPSCKGSGKFRAYTGRIVGDCFKCKGKGTISKGAAAAVKGQATKASNRLLWKENHAAEVEYAQRRAERSAFYAGMLQKLDDFGSWTDGQLALIRSDMTKDDAKRQEWKNERETKSGEIDISAIERLFSTATDNAIKRPIFRADQIVISKAPMHGRNAGALYVTDHQDVYLGKIMSGKFHASRDASSDTLSKLQAVAVDPLAESVKYARRTGNCGCCGRGLVNPVSILANIGPICANKWGLDWKRDLARTEYANMKAEEAEKIKARG